MLFIGCRVSNKAAECLDSFIITPATHLPVLLLRAHASISIIRAPTDGVNTLTRPRPATAEESQSLSSRSAAENQQAVLNCSERDRKSTRLNSSHSQISY